MVKLVRVDAVVMVFPRTAVIIEMCFFVLLIADEVLCPLDNKQMLCYRIWEVRYQGLPGWRSQIHNLHKNPAMPSARGSR